MTRERSRQERFRLAHLVSHPVPYFAPLYRELAARPEIDLTVYFYSDETLREFYHPSLMRTVRWDTPLLGGFRSRILPSASKARVASGRTLRPNVDIVREVANAGYDAVWVHGYAHPTTFLAAAALRAKGVRLLVRDEQTLLDHRPPLRDAARMVALRALLSGATGMYIGEQNRRFLRRYGVPQNRLYAAPYCVDNTFFSRRADMLAEDRVAVRAGFGIASDAPVILFVGRMIEKKRPLLLIEAFERVRRERECSLLIAGDGPMRAAAERIVRERAIPDVHFTGFLGQSELAYAYAAADVFTLPSSHHETWGLVVNEAMNFGLPVVVTDRVGCAADLVRPGWSGSVVPPDDAFALATALGTLVDDAELRARLGANGRDLVREYGIERCADGIVSACLRRQVATRMRREVLHAA